VTTEEEVRAVEARLEQRILLAEQRVKFEGVAFWLHTLSAYLLGALSFLGLLKVLGG